MSEDEKEAGVPIEVKLHVMDFAVRLADPAHDVIDLYRKMLAALKEG